MTETPPVYTLGHSNLTTPEFLEFLGASRIGQLADVRRFPRSRRHPHFDATALARVLAHAGLAYRHFEALGGYRQENSPTRHHALDDAGLRGYAEHMKSGAFRSALTELLAWSADAPTAVLCAEADFRSCHRQLLSDAILRHGHPVVHLRRDASPRTHAFPTTLRLENDELIYDAGMLPF